MTGCQQLRIHEDVGCLNSFGLQTFTLFLYCATQEPFSPRQSSASVNASDHESDMLEEQPWKKTVSVITEWCQKTRWDISQHSSRWGSHIFLDAK
ncbi:hypothetical protein CRM22_007358 [Opisthorchis felineus]|uniref:Uncharacterized protein n=1 Tax=Opisthorchis felineus TaxID=147828 RepID=A0A4S2LP21_OPIFE|nr:hypothetical protein CRM22_007358 [Opisthorchis felineus]